MVISIYCKASTKIGLGHLIRSNSFANQILQSDSNVAINFCLVGDITLIKLVTNKKISVSTYENESDVEPFLNTGIVVIDMIEISTHLLKTIKKDTKASIVLSPVFNNYHHVDYYFGRTKYLNFKRSSYPNLKIFAGFEYAIIQDNCKKISAGIVEQNLNSNYFPIAIIMGGRCYKQNA